LTELTSLMSSNLQTIANPDFPFRASVASVEEDICIQTQSTKSEEADKHERAQAGFLGEFSPHFVAILENRSIIHTNAQQPESGCSDTTAQAAAQWRVPASGSCSTEVHRRADCGHESQGRPRTSQECQKAKDETKLLFIAEMVISQQWQIASNTIVARERQGDHDVNVMAGTIDEHARVLLERYEESAASHFISHTRCDCVFVPARIMPLVEDIAHLVQKPFIHTARVCGQDGCLFLFDDDKSA
jgi:hypothetical protein